MLDYKLLAALSAVLQHGGFEAAARALHLTQSAVSQRIRALEDQLGRPVLSRGSPPQATAAGARLLQHAQQVAALEADLANSLDAAENGDGYVELRVALNNDSLYYWFLDAAAPLLAERRVTLALAVDDEGQTDKLLKAGKVFAAISSRPQAPHGCKTEDLGILRYVCVATPAFRKRFFQKGVTPRALQKAPYIIFDANDNMHAEFLSSCFGLDDCEAPRFSLPAPGAFLKIALQGVAYGFIAEIEAAPHIKAGRLVALTPRKSIDRRLYWHSWYLQPEAHAALGRAVIGYARRHLLQQ